MTDLAYRAFLDLLMCSDPSPVTANQDVLLRDYADEEARKRGYSDWIEAFHGLGLESER